MTRDEIIETTSISDILSGYGVKVDRSGKCCCPLPNHKEKTPSFKIYEKQHRFYCFGCHEKGTVIDLVMKMENCDFKTAFKSLGGTLASEDESEESKKLRLKMLERKRQIEKQRKHDAEFKKEMRESITYCRAAVNTLEAFSDDWCFYKEKLDWLERTWDDKYLNGEGVSDKDVYRVCREVRCHLNSAREVI